MGAFVVGTLRLEPPFRAHYRHVLRDTRVAGVDLPADSMVLLLWGAAGPRPAHVEAPDEFHLDRPTIKGHLTFGKGALLPRRATARLEAMTVLPMLLERTSRLEPRRRPWLPSVLARGATISGTRRRIARRTPLGVVGVAAGNPPPCGKSGNTTSSSFRITGGAVDRCRPRCSVRRHLQGPGVAVRVLADHLRVPGDRAGALRQAHRDRLLGVDQVHQDRSVERRATGHAGPVRPGPHRGHLGVRPDALQAVPGRRAVGDEQRIIGGSMHMPPAPIPVSAVVGGA